MASSKSRSRLLISLVIFSFGIGVFFMWRGCDSDVSPIMSNLVLKKEGKRYLFSMLATDNVTQLTAEGKTPLVTNSTMIYKDGEAVFLQPTSLFQLVAVLRGSYTVHPMRDGSVDGYITVDQDAGMTTENEFKSTDKLGEQHQKHIVTLENTKGKELKIEWTFNPKEGSYYGMKNCETHDFWIQTNPSPGETVWSKAEYLVVSIKSLGKFFGSKIEFDQDSQLLIIEL